ncbi:MAG: bifunctional pyr operon transcriptional regulator/uracil phosphoribosyltransferase PyrR [Atopobiaceae bacterium]|jgi:pyrimidine operon attenuation protein/uracil phosphoribosyltransferase|nr:bifunctional pyr operon transcriptional regulator/uracil phosphoribosyltransferase PyrR [Atopobiaceae bacterium]MCI2050386.1 bifunctional pyr operon transcriptional regulator/uracil phosphoribosyltransferase PyrR [Atopobiaceae bacterium]
MEQEPKAVIMDARAMDRVIVRIAHEIIEHNEGAKTIAVVGIIRRGEILAHRLVDAIEDIEHVKPPFGSLDISFYRDDFGINSAPVVHATNIPFSVEGKDIILVDDVLYTGRTVRSALNALMDYGRAKSVQLAVMVDRGHRELPIRADYVGKNVPSSREEDVRVCIEPLDSHTAVEIWNKADEPSDGGVH